jgi:hypothetical protein
VAMSTVNVDLVPDVLAQPVVEPGWRPLAVLRNAARELVSSLRWLADALIWVGVYFLPLGLIVVLMALVVRLIWRRLRRVQARTS